MTVSSTKKPYQMYKEINFWTHNEQEPLRRSEERQKHQPNKAQEYGHEYKYDQFIILINKKTRIIKARIYR